MTSEYEKEYLEFRIFILGDEGTGKKSFIKKVLSLPSMETVPPPEEKEDKNAHQGSKKKTNENHSADKKQDTGKNDKPLKTYQNAVPGTTNLNPNINYLYNPNTLALGTDGNTIPDAANKNKQKDLKLDTTKVYSILGNKFAFRMFYIRHAEKLPFDFDPKEDDDSEFQFEKDNKISTKQIKKDISEKLYMKETFINEEKLLKYKIQIMNIFVFLYDMTKFETFKVITKYYESISKKYQFSENEFIKCVVIGTKKDREVIMNANDKKIFYEFIEKNKMMTFEVSVKPYFRFEKFFIDFFTQVFGPFAPEIPIEAYDATLSKIVKAKTKFSKGKRLFIEDKEKINVPGPIYDANVYNFKDKKEILQALESRKRFNKKIFVSKLGPKMIRPKSTKEVLVKQQLLKEKENEKLLFKKLNVYNNKNESLTNNANLFNNTRGFSFGITKGRLHLLEERKQMRLAREKSFKDNLAENMSEFIKLKEKNLKNNDIYHEEVLKRKDELFKTKMMEKKKKEKQILENHKENLRALTEENEKLRKTIYKNQKIPTTVEERKAEEERIKKEKQENIKKYYDTLFKTNKEHIDQLEKIKKKNEEEKKKSPFITSPGPNHYDTRGNLLNPNKGPRILGKRKDLASNKLDADYVYFKDDFERIAEKVINKRSKFKERFTPIEKAKDLGPYKDEEKWKNWEENRKNNERTENLKVFIKSREQKLKEHEDLMRDINAQNEELQKMRKEILIKKGYDDGTNAPKINYDLIERAAPSYTMQGRHTNTKNIFDDTNNMVVNKDMETGDGQKAQSSFPLPNFNYIRPTLPSCIFSKDERFKTPKMDGDENAKTIYMNGFYGQPDRKDFLRKEPFSSKEKRSYNLNKDQFPGPNDYYLKTQFDDIVTRGKKESENFVKCLRLKEKENEEKMRRTARIPFNKRIFYEPDYINTIFGRVKTCKRMNKTVGGGNIKNEEDKGNVSESQGGEGNSDKNRQKKFASLYSELSQNNNDIKKKY